MRKISIIVAVLLLTGCDTYKRLTGTGTQAHAGVGSHTRTYILMGQSNMGRNQIATPLNIPGVQFLSNPESGPAVEIGTRLQQMMGGQIRILQCAVGGTYINQWTPGSHLYDVCLNWLPKGTIIDGIFFLQGESDADTSALVTSNWAEVFMNTMRQARRDLGNNNIPIVYGQIGTCQDNAHPLWDHVKAEQASVYLSNAAMIKTDDLATAEGDHHPPEVYPIIGDRFVGAYMELQHV